MTIPRRDRKCEDWKRSQTRILFVTNSIQFIHLTKDALGGFGGFKTGREIISTMKYSDDLVLVFKEGMMIQSMTDRLIKIGRCYGI